MLLVVQKLEKVSLIHTHTHLQINTRRYRFEKPNKNFNNEVLFKLRKGLSFQMAFYIL